MKKTLASGLQSRLGTRSSFSGWTGPFAPHVRRFPPVVQFITRSSPYLEREIRSRMLESFRREGTVEHVCAAIYRTALDAGFHATIGIQEVTSRDMPSFPGETIQSALLLVDLQYDPELALNPRAASG